MMFVLIQIGYGEISIVSTLRLQYKDSTIIDWVLL